jgi:hypothetical protein
MTTPSTSPSGRRVAELSMAALLRAAVRTLTGPRRSAHASVHPLDLPLGVPRRLHLPDDGASAPIPVSA